MGNWIEFILICILLSFLKQINGQDKVLIAGHVVYRHGDRTPITTFPTDPTKASDWPNGFGQLTIAGIEQQYRLGEFIRRRFETLLSANYTPNEIVVRSTDVDRTLMSAQSNLVGLYPAFNETTDAFPIQPIPIHTVPVDSDFLLGQNVCPRADQIVEETMQSDDYKKQNEYYQPFFDKLQNWTNLTNITLFDAWDVADTIYVEKLYNKLPPWAEDPGVRTNLSNINDISFHYLFLTNDSQRIRGGPLVQDIWLNMNNSVNGQPFKKVKMYSAHDTTVSPVLAFLQINYPHQPPYASALFINLYQQNSSYFVRVEYLNETGSNTSSQYTLPGCPDIDCPFDIYTNIYQPRFPTTAAIECIRKPSPMPPSPDDGNGKLIMVLVFMIIGLVTLTFLMFLYLYLRKPVSGRDELLIRGDPRPQLV